MAAQDDMLLRVFEDLQFLHSSILFFLQFFILTLHSAFTSALLPTALLPRNWPTPVFRLPVMQRRSCRSTPVLAFSAERDWPQSQLCVPLKFPERRLPQCPQESAAFRNRGPLPGAAIYRRLLRARQLSPVPRVDQL